MIKYSTFPTWEELSKKRNNGEALNAVENLVYNYEPFGIMESSVFREMVKSALNYVTIEAKRDMTDFIKGNIL